MTIYEITSEFPSSEKFGLVSQMRRAAISVASNIAEGSVGTSAKEKQRFLTIAYGSLIELYNQILIASELEFVTDGIVEELTDDIHEISRIMLGLKKSIKNQ